VLRGVRARGPGETTDGSLRALGADNSFVVVYSQWDSKESYDTFRTLPEGKQPAARRKAEGRRYALTISSDWNTYRVVHSRSASQAAAA